MAAVDSNSPKEDSLHGDAAKVNYAVQIKHIVSRFAGSIRRLHACQNAGGVCRRYLRVLHDGNSGGDKDLAQVEVLEAGRGIAAEFHDPWRQQKVIAYASSAGLVCYYSRSVMSIVVPHISDELSLDAASRTGLLSIFFYGYVLTNIAASVLLQKYHARTLLLLAVLFSSLLTMCLPTAIAIAGYNGLRLCRFASGVMQGFLFPSLYGLLGSELASDSAAKTRGVAVLGGVAQLGVAANFLGSPLLVMQGGWRLAVGVAGFMGLPWCALWMMSSPFCRPAASPASSKHEDASLEVKAPTSTVPYQEILSARPFQAIVCGHFAHNWASNVVMSFLPMYLSQELHLSGRSLGISCLPYIAMAVASPLAGALAEHLLRRRWDVWTVRRCMSIGALLVPAVGLLVFPYIPEALWPLPLVCVTAVMAFSTWASSSVLASPLDIAGPKLSGTLFSISNSICAVPCFLSIEVVGLVRELYGWPIAFSTCSALYVVATVAYLNMGSARRIFD